MASEREALRAVFSALQSPPIPRPKPMMPAAEGAALRAEWAMLQATPAPDPMAHVLKNPLADLEARVTAPLSKPAEAPPPIPQPIPLDTGISRLRSGGRELMRGAGQIIGSIPKSVGIAQGQANKSLLDAFDTIDSGETPQFGDFAPGDFADIGLYRSADAATRKKIRDKVGSIDPRQQPLYQAGEALQRAVKDTFTTNPKYQGEFGQEVAGAVGTTFGFGIASALTKGTGLGALTGAGVVGAATGAAMQFEDAIRHGAPLEDAFEASKLATVTGATEALPIARLLGRLNKSSGGQIKKILLEGLKGGGEEMVQEVIQSIGDNLIASKLVSYDPERGFFHGTAEGAGVGFTVGALFNTVAAMLGAKPRWKPGTPGGPIRGEGTAEFIPTMEVTADLGPTEVTQVPPPAAEPSLEDYLKQAEDRKVEVGKMLDQGKAGDDKRGFGFISRDGKRGASITLSAKESGQWQLTFFDENGFSSDMAFATPSEAAQQADEVLLDMQPDPGVLGRFMATPAFQAGNEALERWQRAQEPVGAPQTAEPVPAPSPSSPTEAVPPPGVAPVPAPPAAEKPPEVEVAPEIGQETGKLAATLPETVTLVGPPATVLTPRGTEVEVIPVLVEAGELLPSSHPGYPAGLQPRDRSRAASAAQVAEIAGNLEPRLLSADTISASDGAPIVGRDLAVESGNARTMAIIAAYDGPAGARYREYLAGQGYPIEGMTAPVLVRLRTGEMSTEERNAFAREANERSTAKMSATEQGQADAATLRGSPLLATIRGGDLDLAANRPFVRAFVDTVVAPAERNAVVNSSGELSQEGRARIENALFASAYNAPDLLEKLREDPDSNIKAIGKALVDVAPAWAQMRARAGNGAIPAAFDISAPLVAATHLVSHARASKSTVGDLVSQQDLFGGGTQEQQTVNALLNLFFRNAPKYTQPRSRKAIAQGLEYYLDQAGKAQAGPSLIPMEAINPVEVLDLAAKGGTADLFPDAAESQELPDVAEMVVHHGTPHTFDRFSTEKIGTGEGAQSFGWGLYFAGKKETAEFYRDALSGGRPTMSLLREYFKPGNIVPTQGGMDRVIRLNGTDEMNWYATVVEVVKRNGEWIDAPGARYRNHSTPPSKKNLERVLGREIGNLYTVDLTPAEDEYLYWDKPLSEQSEKVEATLKALDDPVTKAWQTNGAWPNVTGETLYRHLSGARNTGQKGASQALAKAGIPGIKYLDQGSRGPRDNRFQVQGGAQPRAFANRTDAEAHVARHGGEMIDAGEGSYNYVIFDEKFIDQQTGEILPEVAQMADALKIDPGARHTGRVPDKMDGTPGPGGPGVDPIRREEILAPLLKALKVPLYTGRMGKQPKRVAGFYRRGVEEVRIRHMNDMELAAHELAHMLDDRHPEIRKWWTPASKANETTRAELDAVSKATGYGLGKPFESFAEFVRLWSTQNAEAEARAPTMFREFEHWLAGHKQEAAIRTAQEQMHAWFAQDAQSRLASKMGGDPLTINEHMSGWRDWLRQSILDDLHGVREFEMDVTGGLAPVGAYETSRMLRGNSAMVENVLLYGAPVRQPDGSFRHEGKGLFQILNPLGERLDNFTHYAVARSAAELKTQGRENLITHAEIKAGLALETQEFRKAFQEYQDFNDRLLDFAESMGILDPAKRAKFARSQYIPFYRIAQPGGAGSGRGPAPGEWNGIKALTGGTNNLRDIVGNMIGNAQMLVGSAMTNEARQKIASLAHEPKGGHHMAKIPADDKRIPIDRAQVERKILNSMGITSQIQRQALPVEVQVLLDQIVEGMPEWMDFYQFNQSPRGGNIVAVMNGGKPSYYEVIDPILYRSLVMLNRPRKFWLTTALTVPRRVGQTSVTLSLDFMQANFLRDQLMAGVFSQTGYKPFKDGARGLAARLLKDPDFKDFMLNGGGMASHLLDPDAFKAHMARLDQFYTKKGINPQTVVNTAKDTLLAVEAISNAFEIATRLGEFKRSKARGDNPRHAAYLGREVSVDFSMRGGGLPLDRFSQWNGWDYASAAVNFLYDTVMFLKAATNGLDRVYRGFAKDPHRVSVAWKTAMIATLSAGLAALNMVNPMYDDLEDWDKDGHWHVFLPKTTEGFRMLVSGDYQSYGEVHPHFTHFRYPKIWEIGGIASIAERALTRVATDKPGELPGDAWRIFRNLFHFNFVPQFYAPIYEQDINRLRYYDRPIVPFFVQERKPYAQYTPGTSQTLVALAEKTRHLPEEMQLNPARAEALLRGYFNTWALYGLNLSDSLLFDEAPDMRLDQYPGLRRLYREHPLRSPRQVTEFYDAVKAATAARRTAVHMEKANRPEIAAEERATPENLLYKQLTTAAGRAAKIRKTGRRIQTAPDLATTREIAEAMGRTPTWKLPIQKLKLSGKWGDLGALKRALLDLTIAQRNRIIKATMKEVEGREP